ncbi:disulfide bond formation protein DsbA [Paenarthrobacter nitroguajacolicus]|uniref:Disulfide bond formation protein DsbA n=1 Tax=Paenarthrobacter nitroguajacolicus TaxID=211146 RepID=A0A558GYG9_PAENT|nr:thioredoxin domain-containing protein [Paenarthrobacter nitroguajacolicus]TVU61931.1 disulfide bond formation protein DsbA [Paenarthrobacter nitroguajacolicus]
MTQAPPKPQRPAADTAKKVRIVIWILIAAVVATGAIWFAVFAAPKPAPAPVVAPADGGQLVRDDSHRITAPVTEKAQLVEFLDFECEACRAANPLVEQLKKEYGDRITFVHRYFPLPGHRNSGTSALAVEAAAQQGKYEQMVAVMFETQAKWGEKQDSQAAVFRGYAQDLGLDMARYDADIADEKTKERIRKDVSDGTALGVAGTPTFFLDGKKLALNTEEQFRQLLDDAAK